MTPEELAHAAAMSATQGPHDARRTEPTRHLSWLRIIGVLAVVAAITVGSFALRSSAHTAQASAPASSFMPYVDVTATPTFGFEDATQSQATNVILGFIVSAKNQPCQASWGRAYTLADAGNQLDLDRRIARLRQRGGEVAISFGGQANDELSTVCTDPAQLVSAYSDVVARYSADSIDLDIEGADASSPEASARRADAMHALQVQQKAAGRTLAVWLTLPVDPDGLTNSGRLVLTAMLNAKVDVAGVNGLTMDYGQSLPAGQTMAAASESALTKLAGQLATAYTAAGVRMDNEAAWQHVGATPMIGQNDYSTERFGLPDAESLLAFAQQHHLRRLSMWSLNRDQSCGPNYANVEVVSANCSGIEQQPSAFTKAFNAFTSGAVIPAATEGQSPTATSSSSARTNMVDDPANSPYQIWSPVLPYAKATKVVWHHNVYEAKWWTLGDTPDDPVATASDTPWTLVGPVLPGEHPAPTPTLKVGTYPQWSAGQTYVAGQRVLFDGVGYQAKWYTHGDVPGMVVSDPGQTPWEHITN